MVYQSVTRSREPCKSYVVIPLGMLTRLGQGYVLDGGPDHRTKFWAILRWMTLGFSRMLPSTVPSCHDVGISLHDVDQHSEYLIGWPQKQSRVTLNFPMKNRPLQCELSSKVFNHLLMLLLHDKPFRHCIGHICPENTWNFKDLCIVIVCRLSKKMLV